MHATASPTAAASAEPPRGRSAARQLAARVLAAFVGLIAGVLVLLLVGEALGWAFLRPWLERRASAALGAPVTIEAPLRLHLIGTPEISAGRLRLGAAPGVPAPFLLDASEPLLRVRWGELLALRRGEPPRIALLQAHRLEAFLLREADGRASWRFRPPRSGDERPTAVPRIEALRVAEGLVQIDDVPLQLKGRLELTLDEAAAGGTPGLTVSADGRFRGEPARGRLQAPSALDLLPGGSAAAAPLRFELVFGPTQIHFDGRVRDALAARAFDGRLEVRGASLATVGAPFGVTLPSTPKFSLSGRLARDGAQWSLDADEARVGGSQLRGRFRFDTSGNVPVLAGELAGRRLALADLAPAIGGGAEATPAAAPAKRDRLLPQAEFDLPSLTRMDADVRVALDELDLGRRTLAPLRPVRAHIRLHGGRLAIDDLDARTAGGRLSGSTRLDSSAEPAGWAADLRWRDVDLARWLRRARSEAAAGGSLVTGRLQGDLQLQGRGNSTAQILASLDGRARAVVQDGSLSHIAVELAGLDLAQALGVRLKGDEQLPLSCGVIVAQAKRGVVTPEVAVFDTRDSTITLQGQVDLGAERLGLRALVHPKDVSPLTLRSPLRIEGRFAQPDIGLEKAPIAGRLIAGAALAAINPLAALLPFVDLGDDDHPGCAALLHRSQTRTKTER